VGFVWYYRAMGDEFETFIGNTDTVFIDGPGEFWLRVVSNCCETIVDWTAVGECNGQLILEDQFIYESEYEICQGDSILVAGNYYSNEGVYSDTLLNSVGCDSILISQLSFFQSDTLFLNESICSNENFQVGASIYNETGSYIDTLINSNGCDSIVMLDLTVFEISSLQIDSSICQGDSLWIGTNAYFETGVYSDTLFNQLGCDSIIILDLTVFPQGELFQSISICQGDTFTYEGSSYTETGNFIDSLLNPIGCLQIMNTELIVYENPFVFLGSDTTICENDALILDAGQGFINYLWSNDAITQTISVSDSAWYSVMVTDENDCSSSDSILVSVDICDNVNEMLSDYGIRVYPNPSGGHFYIETSNPFNVKIYSMDGSLVRSMNNLLDLQEVELEESGMYFIQFFEENILIYTYPIIVNL
jgi:hypothetical protein